MSKTLYVRLYNVSYIVYKDYILHIYIRLFSILNSYCSDYTNEDPNRP